MIKSERPTEGYVRGWTEGRIVTNRTLAEYQHMFGFRVEKFLGKKVLNVGAGMSFLGHELKQLGVDCLVIDLDLKNPQEDWLNKLRAWVDHVNYWLDRKLAVARNTQLPIHVPKKTRMFVRADARDLPFPPAIFDYVLCSYMLYQLPRASKSRVIENLMAVGNTIYIGPVDIVSNYLIRRLAARHDFIMSDQAIGGIWGGRCVTLARRLS